jgi:monosaccharide-transporting ATPase
VRGKAVELTSPRKAMALGIAYLPEERAANAIFPAMTVAQNATLPTLLRFVGTGGLLDGRKEVANVSQLLERLDLRPLKGAAKAKLRVFSGGNQQKVIIARWLLGSSAIFMFDEPTQGIDVGAREQVYKVIRELAEQGAGIIIVSSEAEELARLCSKVHIMRDGAIVQILLGHDVRTPKFLTPPSRATLRCQMRNVWSGHDRAHRRLVPPSGREKFATSTAVIGAAAAGRGFGRRRVDSGTDFVFARHFVTGWDPK